MSDRMFTDCCYGTRFQHGPDQPCPFEGLAKCVCGGTGKIGSVSGRGDPVKWGPCPFCDSGSDPKGEDAPAAEGEASQSGAKRIAHNLSSGASKMTDIYKTLAQSHPSLRRGRVWCRTCGEARLVNVALSLAAGWPKCCGYTMTIDETESMRNLSSGSRPSCARVKG